MGRGRTLLLAGSATSVSTSAGAGGTTNQVAKFTGAYTIGDTANLVDTATGVGINKTLTAPTHYVDVVAGTLTSTQYALSVTAVLSSTNVIQRGVSLSITPSTNTNLNNALYVSLNAGSTSTAYQQAIAAENGAAGQGTSVIGAQANYSLSGYTYGTTVGTNVGNFGEALNGIVNIGSSGRSITLKNAGTNIGVLGFGLNTGTTPIQVGGYFGLQSAAPTFTSAALMCDNGTQTDPIFVARNNGTNALVFDDSNNLLIGGATAGTSGLMLFAIKSGTAPSTAPADQIQIYSSDIAAGQCVLSVFQEYAPYGGVGVASTTKIPIIVNGQTLYILATTVQ